MTIRNDPGDEDLQNGTVRRGGAAKGGVVPQPDDPTSPDQADARSAASDAEQEKRRMGNDGPQSVY